MTFLPEIASKLSLYESRRMVLLLREDDEARGNAGRHRIHFDESGPSSFRPMHRKGELLRLRDTKEKPTYLSQNIQQHWQRFSKRRFGTSLDF
jgi:hypothetical protein